MWNITKYEFRYHAVRSVAILLLPFLYLILVWVSNQTPNEENIVARVIYPLLTGMLPVWVIAASWVISIKESRTRLYKTMPLTDTQIALGRLIFAVAHITYLVLFNFLVVKITSPEWNYITNKIIYQYGSTTLLGSSLYLIYEFVSVFELKGNFQILSSSTIIITIVLTIVFMTDSALWNIMAQSNIGIIYLTVGLFVLTAGLILFTKRKQYLS